MSNADLIRVELYAKFRAYAYPWMDWRDLVNEALLRTLKGDRRWPQSISLTIFLRETIRSIASEEIRAYVSGPVTSETDLAGGDVDNPSFDLQMHPDALANPERGVTATELLSKIFALFKDDPNALAILEGLAMGQEPEEVCRAASITRKKYASAQRRIRRRLADEKEHREDK